MCLKLHFFVTIIEKTPLVDVHTAHSRIPAAAVENALDFAHTPPPYGEKLGIPMKYAGQPHNYRVSWLQ